MHDLLFIILLLIVTGIVAGLMAGMLGLGGGFIMVPAQFWILQHMGIASDIAMLVAIGTSVAVIVPTSISGTYIHHRNRNVVWKAGLIIGGFGVLGSLIGSSIAVGLPLGIITFVFVTVLIATAIRMLISPEPSCMANIQSDSIIAFACTGFLTGLLSGMLGIGGGIVLVPALYCLFSFTMHRSVATSASTMMLTSSAAALSYIFYGLDIPGLPPFSLGYVNILNLIVLSSVSIPMSGIGARISVSMEGFYIRYIFIVMLILISLKMAMGLL